MTRFLIPALVAAALFAGCVSPVQMIDKKGDSLIAEYVSSFNAADEEIYVQKYPNSEAETFLKENVPVFECPDKELEKTWYFRWWTFRKHIKSTPEGFVITEFLPDVPWAGKYNAICCPAAHHFNEGRWLKDPVYLEDYADYWCREEDDARRYSYPVAQSFLQFFKVHPDMDLILDSYEDLKEIYSAWEDDHREDPDSLFWQGDGYDGGECSISGYLSDDTSGYRATINSYMYADAVALSTMAAMLGNAEEAKMFSEKAERLKDLINDKLWDESARFYKVIPRHRDGSFSPVREEHGYIPWLYDIPKPEWADAWLQLTDPDGFKAPYGPTTAERRAEGFQILYEGHECQWNGPSWPFATSVALTAYINGLHSRARKPGESERFTFLMWQYAFAHKLHRTPTNPVGRRFDPTVPWIDENMNPDTADWIARTLLLQRKQKPRERGKDYNHSTFCDLVISGLVGFMPEGADGFSVDPLCPATWDYFILDNLRYRGHDVSIRWHRGRGLTVKVDGREAAHSPTLSKVHVCLVP